MMKRSIQLVLGAFAAALAAATLAGAATNQVDGTQHLVGYGETAVVYEMRGSLVGEWLLPYDTLACKEQAKSVQCSGEETFDGFLDANGNGALTPVSPTARSHSASSSPAVLRATGAATIRSPRTAEPAASSALRASSRSRTVSVPAAKCTRRTTDTSRHGHPAETAGAGGLVPSAPVQFVTKRRMIAT